MKVSSVVLSVSIALVTVAARPTMSLALDPPSDLRTEYLPNPLGLDEPAPRLSWLLTSSHRAQRQSAYEILVASSSQVLVQNRGDLWDTGRVASDQTAQIEYAGKSLISREACVWKVRVWDGAGAVGAWSAPASWEMGLLRPADWHAQWIVGVPRAPDLGQLKVLKASYDGVDGGGSEDVTDLLNGRIANNQLSVTVNNSDLGGDPAHLHAKQLRVHYSVGGKEADTVLLEGNTLYLPEGAHGEEAVPYLRKTFDARPRFAKARLYVTALGLYEVDLNGARVGDHVFAPDWTDYSKRVRYQEYDVTGQVKTGANALGALLAPGWYSGHIGLGRFRRWGTTPGLLAQLEITYNDGTVQTVISNTSWKTHTGPILSADIMKGVNYDARAEIPGWSSPGMDEAGWNPATAWTGTAPPIDSQVDEPVRELMEFPAKALTEPAPGRWTFDLGQNMVGVVRLRISEPAGTVITLHHGEMLNPDGILYTANLRGAAATDTYVCSGQGTEVWQPKFTFHGFRYVQLTGVTEKPPLTAVTGIVLGSDTPHAGTFTCSNPLINQLESNIQWGQRGNYFSVPTDCPQRDERLGWMGDAQVFVRSATYDANVAAFFNKWMVDVDDGQTPEGSFGNVSPSIIEHDTPGWGDAGVICPWTIYQVYGDKRLLQRDLPAMERWVDWCNAHSTNFIRDHDRGGDYGDWLAIGADTPKDLIGTAYFAYSTHLVAKAAAAIGDAAAATKYEALFEQIKAAFDQKYVSPDGKMPGDTQTDYAMALKFDLLPEAGRPVAAGHLDDAIHAKNDHLSTGFVGVSYLLPTLTDGGKLETAYKLLLQDTFPSWLFSVKQGATTIWERWDGWTPDKGFQNPSMNSFNHYSLGSCGEWLFSTVAGIAQTPDGVGFQHLIIHPRPGGGLTSAQGEYDSIHGPIKTSWSEAGGKYTLRLTIPVNTTARVFVPAASAAGVTEGNGPATASPGVKFVDMEEGCAVFEVKSGRYVFGAKAG